MADTDTSGPEVDAGEDDVRAVVDRPYAIVTDREGTHYDFTAAGVPGRSCGTCSLCCVLVPVNDLVPAKPGGVPCRHLRGGAAPCRVYADRPTSCRGFRCRWLADPSVVPRGLKRPDAAGYVIDPMHEMITLRDEAGHAHPQSVVVIWVAPARPRSYRDPALRAWLSDLHAIAGVCALVRRANGEALLLLPRSDRSLPWREIPVTVRREPPG